MKYFDFLKDCFTSLCAQISFPVLGTLDFSNFAQQCKFDENDPAINLSTLDRTFIAASLQIETQNLKGAELPSDKLNRFEFIEILVRLANIKFCETKKLKSISEATQVLIEDYIKKYFTPEPWQKFRDEQLWTIPVQDLLEANLNNLTKIYESYKTQVKKFMDMKDCIVVCAPLEMSEKDIALAYGMSKMTIMDEVKFFKRYQ